MTIISVRMPKRGRHHFRFAFSSPRDMDHSLISVEIFTLTALANRRRIDICGSRLLRNCGFAPKTHLAHLIQRLHKNQLLGALSRTLEKKPALVGRNNQCPFLTRSKLYQGECQTKTAQKA
jgi:hypothetical protein